jgi:hypothetical protein
VASVTDGSRAIQFVKSSSIIRRVPVIAIVGIGRDELASESDGADQVLYSPFTADDVAELAIRMTQRGRW